MYYKPIPGSALELVSDLSLFSGRVIILVINVFFCIFLLCIQFHGSFSFL